MANIFNCSRLTIRKAIDELIKKKIIVKKKGKGSYILPQTKIQSGRSGLQSFTEAAKSYGKSSQTKIISFKIVEQSIDDIRTSLNISNEVKLYELVRCRLLENKPMTVEKIYLPEKYIINVPKEEFENSLFSILEEKVDIAYSIQEIEAVLVDETISPILEIPVGNPLLQAKSITYEVNATPIFFDISFYRADQYSFKNTLTRMPL